MRVITRQDCQLYREFYASNPVIVAVLDIVVHLMDEKGVDQLECEPAPNIGISA
jgi:hypothetical protein